MACSSSCRASVSLRSARPLAHGAWYVKPMGFTRWLRISGVLSPQMLHAEREREWARSDIRSEAGRSSAATSRGGVSTCAVTLSASSWTSCCGTPGPDELLFPAKPSGPLQMSSFPICWQRFISLMTAWMRSRLSFTEPVSRDGEGYAKRSRQTCVADARR
eukprot:scaffold492_cov257-Pinguiococcus_pyrenoidosus.AAC.45